MIIRTYRCNDCERVFDVTLESGNDPDPVCPHCPADVVLQWQPKRFAIGGSVASAAVDVTQKILEQDYGMSNMQDGMREGDAAFKGEVKQGAQIEAETRQMIEAARETEMLPAAKQFFSGSPGGPPAGFVQGALADAKAHKEHNPIELLHAAGRKGELGIPFNPLFKG